MSKDIAKVEENKALAVFGAEEAGIGFEGTGGRDYAIPFLTLLQKGSPQCDPDKGEYIAEAKPGQLLDAATGELLDEIRFIPCHYKASMTEWHPREEGGGLVAIHEVGFEVGLGRDDKGRFVTPAGTHVIDTRSMFGLRLTKDGSALPMVISFTSTQIKKVKTWMTRMQAIKADNGNGGKYTPAMFAHIWKIGTVAESNNKGSWRGFDIKLEGPVADRALYDKAKESREMFLQAANVTQPVAAPGDAAEQE